MECRGCRGWEDGMINMLESSGGKTQLAGRWWNRRMCIVGVLKNKKLFTVVQRQAHQSWKAVCSRGSLGRQAGMCGAQEVWTCGM
jgi:hypothetical protein